MSGDVDISPGGELRNLLAKGLVYREPSPFYFDRAKEEIQIELDSCIDSLANKAGVD